MMQQAIDFRDESDALYALLRDQPGEVFVRPTRFKNWTVTDILGHLHVWNEAADLSLGEPERFRTFLDEVLATLQDGSLRDFERRRLGRLEGHALLEAWHDFYGPMSQRFAAADPRHRVQWAGPDMSVRSSITARLMETWAHAQAIYDLLGLSREDADRIRNIAELGVKTYAWTFRNRGRELPGAPPRLRLTAPSGAVWTWHEDNRDSSIEGSATAFCQVVTQTRNVADTDLRVAGEAAREWMAVAQCFAGPPVDPPAPGTRYPG